MIPLIVTISVAATGVLWAVLGFVTRRSPRAILRGAGLALAGVGIYLLGWTDLTVNGINSLIAWVQRTIWSSQLTTGAILGGLGVAAFMLAGLVRPGKAVETGQPQLPAKQGSTSANSPAIQPRGKVPAKGLDPEDAEIEALLRARGIE